MSPLEQADLYRVWRRETEGALYDVEARLRERPDDAKLLAERAEIRRELGLKP